MSNFSNAVHLFPTIEAVAEHNMHKLHGCGQPVAPINPLRTVVPYMHHGKIEFDTCEQIAMTSSFLA